MKIYHPQSGFSGATRDQCFLVSDNAGVELGQGSVVARNVRDVYPERPLEIVMDMDAHPRARDMLYGALRAEAAVLHRQAGRAPGRLYIACQMGDVERYHYFKSLGFDDTDGDELFVWRLSKHERTVYPPLSTQIIEIPRRSRSEAEGVVRRMQAFGAGEHAVEWLEDFILECESLIIVVSHDRHFLNTVCTNIVDVDYGGIKMYVGNYEFWYESSQMMQRLIRDQNKKKEEKIKELQEFVSRFSANKSKSKQATARRKLLDKLTVEEMPASSRRYPFVGFKMDREPGKEILAVEGLTKTVDGRKVLDNVSFRVNKGDKIAFVGEDEIATTTLFKILMEELEPDAGTFKWGTTITTSYFPLDNSAFFNDCDLNLVDWLGQYTADNAEEGTESFKRSFLGRMLFSGDDVYKPVKVLSGGEKVRCMLSRMMLFGSNALVLDQPTNHLDLESITAVNNGLIDFKGVVLFASHDHEFVQTIANRVMEFVDGKLIDKMCTYDAYIAGAREEMLARLNG